MGAPSCTSFVAESESIVFEAGSIDRVKGLVRNVRVCGPRSKNGRKYPLPVMERSLSLYAAPSYIGHHFDPHSGLPIEPPTDKKFGRMIDPRSNSGGIVADYKFNPEHAFAKPFLWAAENDPKEYCFSPIKRVRWEAGADGRPRLDSDGDQVAESILDIASVDVVSAGGTTSSIFESLNKPTWAFEMAAPDAQKIADSLETDGAWIAFLTDLFAKMKGLSQPTKDAISAMMAAAMAGSTDAAVPAEGADAAALAPAMESLRRFGPVGRWAAKRLDALFVAEAATKRNDWAAALIKSEGVAEGLITPLFTSMVAESFGNDARAKEIIADRKKLGTPAGGGKGGQTSDRTGVKTVAELVAGYVAG